VVAPDRSGRSGDRPQCRKAASSPDDTQGSTLPPRCAACTQRARGRAALKRSWATSKEACAGCVLRLRDRRPPVGAERTGAPAGPEGCGRWPCQDRCAIREERERVATRCEKTSRLRGYQLQTVRRSLARCPLGFGRTPRGRSAPPRPSSEGRDGGRVSVDTPFLAGCHFCTPAPFFSSPKLRPSPDSGMPARWVVRSVAKLRAGHAVAAAQRDSQPVAIAAAEHDRDDVVDLQVHGRMRWPSEGVTRVERGFRRGPLRPRR